MTGDERGSAAVELVLLAPALIVLLLFVVYGGRLVQARGDIDEAARDAARAASLARSPSAAVVDGQAAAAATLGAGHVTCRDLRTDVDTADFTSGGTVTVTVTCTTDMADVTGLAVPASRTITSRFTEPIDLYRTVSG